MSKQCVKCLTEKPYEEFGVNNSTKDRLMRRCKQCIWEQRSTPEEKAKTKERNRRNYLANREERIEYAINYEKNNLAHVRQQRARRQREKYRKDKLYYCNERARRYRDFDAQHGWDIYKVITGEDILSLYESQDGKCVYSGVVLEMNPDADIYHRMSVDRIDNSKGHTLDNVQLVSYYMNSYKAGRSHEEFLKVLEANN